MAADLFVVRHSESGAPYLIAQHVAPHVHVVTTLGCAEVRVVGPKTLVPGDMAGMGVRVCHTLEEGIKDCDVVIMLRLQNERMSGALLPSSQEFFKTFGLTQEKLQLAKPDAIVMHPGPINRGVEIDSAVVDGKQSVILPQSLSASRSGWR